MSKRVGDDNLMDAVAISTGIDVERKKFLGDDLTVESVGKIVDRDKATVLRWIREGKLVAYQIGKTYFVTREDLQAFKEGLRQEGHDKARAAKLEADTARRYEFMKLSRSFADSRLCKCPRCGYRTLIMSFTIEENPQMAYLDSFWNRWAHLFTGTCAYCAFEYRWRENDKMLEAWGTNLGSGQKRIDLAVAIVNEALETINQAERLRLLRNQLGNGYTVKHVRERLEGFRASLQSLEKEIWDEKVESQLQELEEALLREAEAPNEFDEAESAARDDF
jgi:excisionase family DNA binding protein